MFKTKDGTYTWKYHSFNDLFCHFSFSLQYHAEATFWKIDYDQQHMAHAQQWTNSIQTDDAGALIYISMPQKYPTTAHEPLASAYANNNNNYVAQRNHIFANRPIKKPINQRTSAPVQSIPSSSLQYSSYTHLPATKPVHNSYDQQQSQIVYPTAVTAAAAKTNQLFSNVPPVDEYLLHGEMPLPLDQTYIVLNAAPDMPLNVESDYLT